MQTCVLFQLAVTFPKSKMAAVSHLVLVRQQKNVHFAFTGSNANYLQTKNQIGQKNLNFDSIKPPSLRIFFKKNKVPLENVPKVPCVKYKSPRMNRKKTAFDQQQQHTQTDTHTEATTILEMQNLHFK